MINKVSTTEKSPFLVVSNKIPVQNRYWVSMPQKVVETTVYDDIIADLSWKLLLPPRPPKPHSTKKIVGISIAGAVVLSATTIFFILRGGPKSIAKNFNNFKKYLEKKILKQRLNNPENQKISKFYSFMIGATTSLLKRIEVINNFTTLKDFALKNAMENKYSKRLSGKLHRGITKLFERICRRSVKERYKHVAKDFRNISNISQIMEKKILFKDAGDLIEINGVTKTKLEWLYYISKLNQDITKFFEEKFSGKSLLSRYISIKRVAKNLENNFKNRGPFWFWSKDVLNKFVADKAITPEKEGLQKLVKAYRNKISHNDKDLYNDIDKLITKIMSEVSFKDSKKIEILRNINQLSKKYSNIPAEKTEMRSKVEKEIISQIGKFTKEINISYKNKNMDSELSKSIVENILEIKRLIQNNQKGKVEEILTIYKNLLPPEDYRILERYYKTGVRSLDKAITTETEDFMNKIRDLTMGSAPTDIISVLGGLTTLSYYVATTKGKEEKTSVILKYGTSAIAGILTTLYCNAKLYAGSKSLALGLLSMISVGILGNISDTLIKRHYELKAAKND